MSCFIRFQVSSWEVCDQMRAAEARRAEARAVLETYADPTTPKEGT